MTLRKTANTEKHWQGEHSAETTASAATIWKFFSAIRDWPRWNAGVESIEIDGPFAAGTLFQMKPPGQEVLTSQLVEVRVNRGFIDETAVGDFLVRVSHRIEELPSGRRKIVYAVEAIGPGAAEIGPAISADFPDVLRSLCALAEKS